MYLMIQEYRPDAMGDVSPTARKKEHNIGRVREARTDESYILAAIAAPQFAWVVDEATKNQIMRTEAGVRSIELSDEDYRSITRRAAK